MECRVISFDPINIITRFKAGYGGLHQMAKFPIKCAESSEVSEAEQAPTNCSGCQVPKDNNHSDFEAASYGGTLIAFSYNKQNSLILSANYSFLHLLLLSNLHGRVSSESEI